MTSRASPQFKLSMAIEARLRRSQESEFVSTACRLASARKLPSKNARFLSIFERMKARCSGVAASQSSQSFCICRSRLGSSETWRRQYLGSCQNHRDRSHVFEPAVCHQHQPAEAGRCGRLEPFGVRGAVTGTSSGGECFPLMGQSVPEVLMPSDSNLCGKNSLRRRCLGI